MRIVLQRVSRASVTVAGDRVSGIGGGFLLLVGIARGDTRERAEWLAEKVCGLRVFPDDSGRMNLGLAESGGEILAVSQFTLLADTRKGKRPSFAAAAPPGAAEPLFEYFCDRLREREIPVSTGTFGAMMEVELVNDGPVTITLER